MKKYLQILILMLAAVSCELLGDPQPKFITEQPSGYTAFMSQYKACHSYISYEIKDSVLAVTFDDRNTVLLDLHGMVIQDCTVDEPMVVSYDYDDAWMVGGRRVHYKRDVDLKDYESIPFYFYYTKDELHFRITNGNHLIVNYKDIELLGALPKVFIVTDDRQSVTSKEVYKTGSITITDADHKFWNTDEFKATMKIRGRGNSTWGMPKKPYKIKFTEKQSIFGVASNKDWCLLANYCDKSLMRNRVVMELSRKAGFSWTPAMYPVDVYLNGSYQGVYDWCEHKEVAKNKVNIKPEEGDYYFEIDSRYGEPINWDTPHGCPICMVEPETATPEQIQKAKDFFVDFETALWEGNYEEVYDKYIDLDSFINYFIVEEFSKDVDGNLRLSTFMTLTTTGKLEMYHLWDFDISLGNCDYYGDGKKPWEGWWVKKYGWYARLFKDPYFVEQVKARWNELYPEIEETYNYIDRQVELMGDSPAKNFQRWNILNSYVWPNYKVTGSYEGEVAWLKEVYSKRLEWMNTNINGL